MGEIISAEGLFLTRPCLACHEGVGPHELSNFQPHSALQLYVAYLTSAWCGLEPKNPPTTSKNLH